MLASGAAESYGVALRHLLDDDEIDAVIVLFIPPLVTAAADVAAALVAACDPPPAQPVLACFVGTQGTPNALRGRTVIPSYTFPEIAFGLGGVLAEALGDVAFRLHPLTDVDAEEVIASVKAARLLEGYRGSPPADVAALRALLLRVSQLVEDLPEIGEIDINPVMVRAAGQGLVALDARIRLRRLP